MEPQEKKRRITGPQPQSVTEIDVGITEFVYQSNPGFDGLLKQRFSDFQVNEIDLSGEVVVLKHIKPDAPADSSLETKNEPVPQATEPAPAPELEPIDLAFKDQLTSVIGEDTVSKCADLYTNGGSRLKTKQITDKSVRSQVHDWIRQMYHSKLDTTTEDGCIVIQKVTKKTKKRNNRDGNAGKTDDFLHFTLYKENRDTLEAVNTVAKFLHCPTKAFAFAGTKDRRAATTQRISWRRGSPARIMGLNQALHESIRVGDCKFERNGLRLGDLNGNQFEIVIRNVKNMDKEVIDAALSSLQKNGFINYFGLQRFGTFSVPSHQIGKFILCEDYDSAVNSLLDPQEITNEDSRPARDVWFKEKDAAKALELMPRRCVAETSVLTALTESPSSINALLRIPRSLKTMYLHAYQSYVWNNAASARIKMNPYEVIAGDLVFGEKIGNVQRARPVTEEELANKVFSIHDVVLPTPGFDVIYPENIVKVYEDVMSKENIDCHNMKRKIKEFSLYGTYRYALAKPLFLDWEFRKYEGPESTIVYTDKEALEHESKLAPEPTPTNSSTELSTAVVVKLGLATSQYATMALREVMRRDTSRHGSLYFE